MDRELFARRLVEFATRTLEFSRPFLEEALPDELRFRVRIGAPDGALRADQQASRTADEVVELLWRDGAVPEWVNLQVAGVDHHATLIEVLCCRRFTANDARLYYGHDGRHPFQALGPALPLNYEEGTPFSIHHHRACATKDGLVALLPHASKVLILSLVGTDFDDAALAALPCFPNALSLVLEESPVRGLAFLDRLPKVRSVFVALQGQPFTAKDVPAKLETLAVSGLPVRDWDVAAAVSVTHLELTSGHPMHLDGRWPASLSDLSLAAPHAEGPLPKSLEHLHVRLTEADDEELERLLAATTSVRRLNMRSTRASEASLGRVLARVSVEVLDVGRHVSEAAVQRLMAANPRTKIRRNGLVV